MKPTFPVDGEIANFNCKVHLRSNLTGGIITWYLDGFIIRGAPIGTTGRRVQEEQWGDGVVYESHLRIQSSKWSDSGMYRTFKQNVTCLSNVYLTIKMLLQECDTVADVCHNLSFHDYEHLSYF